MGPFVKLMWVILLMKGPSVWAQGDRVDTFIKARMVALGIPGLQLAVVQQGMIVKTANYGWANLQDSIAVSDKTVFTINSITKAFTGVAILQLVEAGKLRLSAPVSAYLTGLPASWQHITIQQLLSHLSGLPDIVDEESMLLSPQGELASWNLVQTLPVAFPAGERFSYNQTNYLLLGRIIDQLSGMPFSKFILQEQLIPAGMHQTAAAGFGATKEVIPHAASGYINRKGKLNNLFFSYPPSLQTAAGMSSTARDLAAWIIALQDGKILKQRLSLTALWSPASKNNGTTGGFDDLLNGYAAGWPVAVRTKHPAVAAVGGNRSALFVYPEDDLSIIVLTNLAGSTPESFMDQIAKFYLKADQQ